MIYYSNSKAPRMSVDTRFKYADNKLPGPGTYEETGQVAAGRQVCSNYHTTLVKNLGTTEKRPDWSARFKTPGPGAYRPPVEFGYFDHGSRMDNMANTHSSSFSISQTLNFGAKTHTDFGDYSPRSDKKRRAPSQTIPAS